MKKLSIILWSAILIFAAANAFGEDIPDFTVENPNFNMGEGPVIAVDEAHNNEHTLIHKFGAFGALAEKDGFQVQAFTSSFTPESLADVDILISATAMDATNAAIEDPDTDGWILAFDPVRLVYPMSAYTDEEIAAVQEWVKQGGSLMLVSDHMPFPASQQKLAKAFGVIFENAFAFDSQFLIFAATQGQMGSNMANLLKYYTDPASASESNGKLYPHEITNGLDYVTSFVGSGMRVLSGVNYQPLLETGNGTLMHYPYNHVKYETFPPTQLSLPLGDGMLQGLTLSYGKGRVAIFAEAAMFSSVQSPLDPSIQNGFLHPEAEYNMDFALNTLTWLVDTPQGNEHCVTLGDDFGFTLPSINISGVKFGVHFSYVEDSSSFQLDVNSISNADPSAGEIMLGHDTSLTIPCIDIFGMGYSVTLIPVDGQFTHWTLTDIAPN